MEKKSNMKFLRTDSKEAREKLLSLGFTEIETQDKNVFTFLKKVIMYFSKKALDINLTHEKGRCYADSYSAKTERKQNC